MEIEEIIPVVIFQTSILMRLLLMNQRVHLLM